MDILMGGFGSNNASKAGYIPIDKVNQQFGRAQSSADYQKSIESVLENKLENKLGNKINALPASSRLNTDNFSPQSVANRIISFVGDSLTQQGGSNEDAEAMLKEAKKGIEQGIKEARNILDGMGKLSDSVDSNIKETEKLISQGLEKLEKGLEGDGDSDDKAALKLSDTAQLISSSASLSTEFKQSSEASIEIVTRDGDKVNVSYSAFIQAASNERVAVNQQGSAYSSAYSAESSVTFQFSVQGNIDSGEQQAIESLLTDVGKLAETFFQGDVQAAFNASIDLGFDTSELQSFALDFQQSTYVEVAQTYQQTQQINNPPVTSPDSGPKAAIDVLSQLNDLLDKNKENTVVNKPQDTIKLLLGGLLDLAGGENDKTVKNYISELVGRA